jgi:hypothetical protein
VLAPRIAVRVKEIMQQGKMFFADCYTTLSRIADCKQKYDQETIKRSHTNTISVDARSCACTLRVEQKNDTEADIFTHKCA